MNRVLSRAEIDLLEELSLYDKVISLTSAISVNQQGIKTDGRGIRAMKIFTRQTLTAISLRNLLPNLDAGKERDAEIWDINSLASLTRSLMEGYISLDYFGLERISESEADLRFQLLQFHRNIELYNIRFTQLDAEERHQFEDGISTQKEKIRAHQYLSNLTSGRQKRVLRWQEMYKAKSDFESEIAYCRDLVEHYRLLSNFVHPLPLSIERTDNERGRGWQPTQM